MATRKSRRIRGKKSALRSLDAFKHDGDDSDGGMSDSPKNAHDDEVSSADSASSDYEEEEEEGVGSESDDESAADSESEGDSNSESAASSSPDESENDRSSDSDYDPTARKKKKRAAPKKRRAPPKKKEEPQAERLGVGRRFEQRQRRRVPTARRVESFPVETVRVCGVGRLSAVDP